MFYASDVNDTARLDKVEYLLLREAQMFERSAQYTQYTQ